MSSSRTLAASGQAQDPVDRLTEVVLSGRPLADLSDAKARRIVTRRLVRLCGSDERAAQALITALKGPLPKARPIARTLGQSVHRGILIQAWTELQGELALGCRTPGEVVDLKQVADRAKWVAGAQRKLRGVQESQMRSLLAATVDLAIAVLEGGGESGREAAAEALVSLIVSLSSRIDDYSDYLLECVLYSEGEYRARVGLAERLASTRREGLETLLDRLGERAFRFDPDLSLHLLTTRFEIKERASELVRLLKLTLLVAPSRVEAAERVLVRLLSDAGPRQIGAYLDPILVLSANTRRLPPDLEHYLRVALTEGGDRGEVSAAIMGVVASVLEEQRSRHEQTMAELREKHRGNLRLAGDRMRELERQLHEAHQLVESVKKGAKRPTAIAEHRVRAAVLTPLCLIHQEMMLSLGAEPQQRLFGFAQMLNSAIVRQGVTIFGEPGERARFDGNVHEVQGRAGVRPQEDVIVAAPGYRLVNQEFELDDVLARAIVQVPAE